MPTPDGPEEAAARAVVGSALRVPVRRHDDGSANGMVDALIDYPDSRVGALEIVGDHDADFLKLWQVLEQQGHATEVPGLTMGWSIQISHRVRLKTLLDDLPRLISSWESAGLTDLANPRTAAQRQLANTATRQGIVHATVTPGLDPGRVRFYAEGWSGISDSTSLAVWVETFLASCPDVEQKLAAHPGVDERHVYIWTTIGSEYAIQSILERRDDGGLLQGEAAPNLGNVITHVWIAGSMSTQGAVAWSPDRGWWRVPPESLPHLGPIDKSP